jgi:CHAD domain-containing protein
MPLNRYVCTQREAIGANEPGVRRGDPDPVHDMRVATRRLRSTLRTFRPLLDRDRTEPLRTELRWLAHLLGDVRDGDVMSRRLAKAIAAEPPELVLGPVAARIRGELATRAAEARAALAEGLDSQRYTDLLAALDRLDLPTGTPAKRLRKLTRKAFRRADDRLEAATGDEALHEARKAYKRARYAAEALVPQAGRPARRLARRTSELQDVLGTHQDTIVTGDLLRGYGVRAHLSGDNAFTFGLMHARQRAAGDRVLDKLPAVRRRATKSKVREWLA